MQTILTPGRVLARRYTVEHLVMVCDDFELWLAGAVGIVALSPVLVTDARARHDLAALFAPLPAPVAAVTTAWRGSGFEDPLAWGVIDAPAGLSLAHEVAQGALAVTRARALLDATAAALATLHAHGMTYGAVRADRVWAVSSREGCGVRILAPRLPAFVQRARSTSTRVIPVPTARSLDHLAPEQVMGRDAVPATDVWAFAMLAFELLTGEAWWDAPHTASSALAMFSAMMTRPLARASERAASTARAHALPAGFDAWFAQCTAREPAARPTMAEARAQLGALAPR